MQQAESSDTAPALAGYMTTGEAASLIGVSLQTIRNWVRDNRLVGSRVAGEHWSHARLSTLEVNAKSQSEAASILEAVKQGLVKNPRRPMLANGEPNLDFVIEGGYADIKTPIDPVIRSVQLQAADIAAKTTVYDSNVKVIIDLKNLSEAQKVQFQTELGNRGGITSQVKFINL